MKEGNNLIRYLGFILLLLTIVNHITSNAITPEFQRAEILAAFSSIILLVISLINYNQKIKGRDIVDLNGKQVFYIDAKLDKDIRYELGWGSDIILRATAACSIIVFYKDIVVLKRGLSNDKKFIPGKTCEKARKEGKMISLVNLKFYPDKNEFNGILDSLPSVIIYPLFDYGYIVIGGAKSNCFTKSDEKWINGWCLRLGEKLKKN